MPRQFSGWALTIGVSTAFLTGGLSVWAVMQTFVEPSHHQLRDICMFTTSPREDWTPITKVMDRHLVTEEGRLFLPAYGGLFGFDHKCGFHPDLIVEYLQEGGYVTIQGLHLAYIEALRSDHTALKAVLERITDDE